MLFANSCSVLPFFLHKTQKIQSVHSMPVRRTVSKQYCGKVRRESTKWPIKSSRELPIDDSTASQIVMPANASGRGHMDDCKLVDSLILTISQFFPERRYLRTE